MNYKKPLIKEIEILTLSDYSKYQLGNGINVYELNFPQSAEVVKLDFVFKGGRLYEKNKLAAKICASIIKEGTKNYNSKEIAHQLDFYGAYIEAQSSMDYTRLSVLCLNKHFSNISDLVNEILFQPKFDQDEFDKHNKRAKEHLKMQLSKNDIVGYRELTEQLFGSTHPYGYNSIADDYDTVTLESVVEHYQDFYTIDNCTLFISGNISTELRQQIDDSIGIPSDRRKSKYINPITDHTVSNKYIRIEGHQSIQKAIYIGAKTFGRNHPDYIGMLLLNTLLGGYFSSRLNRRIREKEALTYGIDAQLDIMREDGFFYISTEVENNNEVATLKAIYEELELLRTTIVNEEELDNVKRYIKGQILNTLDGPFKQIKVLQSMVINDIDPDKFTFRIDSVDLITREDLLRLAKKYYIKENLIEVVVYGK